MILAELNRLAIESLATVYPENTEFEVECLLKFYFKYSSAQFIQALRSPISEIQYIDCMALIKRRMACEPLDYILESSSFMGRNYHVGPGVLIPRAETELLVQEAQSLIPHYFSDDFIGLEFGFGSGVISIELALTFLSSQWKAFDISKDALNYAQKNALQYHVHNIDWKCMDFFDSEFLWESYNQPLFLISNPPYIPSKDIDILETSVKKYEPKIALDGGKSGLDMYKRMFAFCQDHEFVISLECGIDQDDDICDLSDSYGFTCINRIRDYHAITRVLSFTNLS